MATLREDDPATLPEARDFLLGVQKNVGEVFNSVRMLANHPRDGVALVRLIGSLRREMG